MDSDNIIIASTKLISSVFSTLPPCDTRLQGMHIYCVWEGGGRLACTSSPPPRALHKPLARK